MMYKSLPKVLKKKQPSELKTGGEKIVRESENAQKSVSVGSLSLAAAFESSIHLHKSLYGTHGTTWRSIRTGKIFLPSKSSTSAIFILLFFFNTSTDAVHNSEENNHIRKKHRHFMSPSFSHRHHCKVLRWVDGEIFSRGL